MNHYGEQDGIEEFYKNYRCLYILDKFSTFVLPNLIEWKLKTKCVDFLDLEMEDI